LTVETCALVGAGGGADVPGRGCCALIEPTQMAAKKVAAAVARNIFISFS
jgi:hypothetical protein